MMITKFFAKTTMSCSLALTVTVAVPFWTNAAEAAQKALLIGVANHPHSPSSNLNGPPHDLKVMTKFLKEQWGFKKGDIGILKDAKATKKAILSAISNWLPKVSKPGDRVVIYYSGHGTQVPDQSGDEADGKDEGWVSADWGKGGKKRIEQVVLDDDLAVAFRKLADREVILISDSCHSGTMARSITLGETEKGNDKERFEPFDDPSLTADMPLAGRDEEPLSREVPAHLTISAAMANQSSWESGGRGVFTYHFIRGMSDGRADFNKNGRISSAEIMNYVRPRTEQYCQKVAKCRPKKFTPNIDPRNEAFILSPMKAGPTQTIVSNSNQDVSDILPPLQQNALNIAIRPGADHKLGDEVTFEIKTAFDGYLTLLDLNAANEMVLLFPTEEDLRRGKNGKIRAKSKLIVPDASYGFAFEAGLPTGKGQLMAIVTQDKIDFSKLLKAHRDFEPIKDKAKLVKKMSEKLYGVWTGEPDHNRAVHWAVGYTDYSISK